MDGVYGSLSDEADRALMHVLTFLGEMWGCGDPRFEDELVIGYTRYINKHGGVVTWDVPIPKDGRIPDAFLAVDEAEGLNDRAKCIKQIRVGVF